MLRAEFDLGFSRLENEDETINLCCLIFAVDEDAALTLIGARIV